MVTNTNSLESKANSLVPLFQSESQGETIHLKDNEPVGGITFALRLVLIKKQKAIWK